MREWESFLPQRGEETNEEMECWRGEEKEEEEEEGRREEEEGEED